MLALFHLPTIIWLVNDAYEINHSPSYLSREHMNPKLTCSQRQLVERRTGIARSRVQAPLKSWIFFRLLYAIAKIAIITARIILHLKSYDCNTVPSDWSSALVTAIFKKGNKSDPANYRPISLTCICCKIMEHIILSHMSKHLSLNNNNMVLERNFLARHSSSLQYTTGRKASIFVNKLM